MPRPSSVQRAGPSIGMSVDPKLHRRSMHQPRDAAAVEESVRQSGHLTTWRCVGISYTRDIGDCCPGALRNRAQHSQSHDADWPERRFFAAECTANQIGYHPAENDNREPDQAV